MMGKTHKAVGICTAVSVGAIGLLKGDVMMLVTAITIPAGAMFPDIDHNSSKLGRTRKQVVGVVAHLAKLAILLASIWVAITINLLVGGLFGLVAVLFSRWSKRKEKFSKGRKSFLTKHRGIMHTCVIPLLIYGLGAYLHIAGLSQLLYGFAYGDITHLAGDCLTEEGCPVLWPLTEKNISIIGIKTGTKAEKILAGALSVAIIFVVKMIYM